MLDKEKDVTYENATRPQIVKIINMVKTDVQYEVIKGTSNNPKKTFICTIDRFNNIYTKI